MFQESFLHRMQRAALGQALNRGDLLALRTRGQHQAGEHALAVHMHGAGAATAMIAALLGAGELGVFAQCVEQRGALVHLQRMRLAVDGEGDGNETRAGRGGLRNARVGREAGDGQGGRGGGGAYQVPSSDGRSHAEIPCVGAKVENVASADWSIHKGV